MREAPVLPAALPNRLITRGASYDALPEALKQRMYLRLAGNSVELPWAKINNHKLTLSFRPATEEDEAVLEGILPEGKITDISELPSSIPAYLIRVVPELKLDGELILAAPEMTLGAEIELLTRVRYPTLTVPDRRQSIVAGSYLIVNTVAGNVSPDKLQTLRSNLEETKAILKTADPSAIAGLTRRQMLGDLFHAGSLSYFAQLLGFGHIAERQASGQFRLGASLGTIGYEPEVAYVFGVPRAIEPGGVALDIPLQFVTAVDHSDRKRHRQFNLQIGALSSALEHIVPEQMFGTEDEPAEAISAVRALQKASVAGQCIYHLTSENMDSTLPSIKHDAETMAEIRVALNAGKEVITHTATVSVPGWSGAGYVILDPETGVGAWKIDGGANGGALILLGLTLIVIAVIAFLGLSYVLLASTVAFPLVLPLVLQLAQILGAMAVSGILFALSGIGLILGDLDLCNLAGGLALAVMAFIIAFLVIPITAFLIALFFDLIVAAYSFWSLKHICS